MSKDSEAFAIEATAVGKRYELRRGGRPSRTLVEAITAQTRAPIEWLRMRGRVPDESDFWALRDASFSIPAGEAVGIIGRNGAGKSTLLKILSRVTDPTEGRIHIRGRVASLLEVGTGFHHELSGRENIFLNGAILGMRRKEITARLDQIVEFAGVSQFLDEPIKHFSSGMYTRLAFAVAAFLESEILIVDEVLAVGDLAFQEKCLGTMQSAATSGRTVLFVSHNMAAVAQLTSRTLLLDQGRIVFDGSTREATEHYIGIKHRKAMTGRLPVEQIACSQRWHRDEHLRIVELGPAENQPEEIVLDGSVRLEVAIQAAGPYDGLRIAYSINNAVGAVVLSGLSPPFSMEAGTQLFELTIDAICLVPGEYDFTVHLGTGGLTELKMECDALHGFGRLRVSPLLSDGRLFGTWHSVWGSVVHRSSRWRQL